jgi:hypothetical protein
MVCTTLCPLSGFFCMFGRCNESPGPLTPLECSNGIFHAICGPDAIAGESEEEPSSGASSVLPEARDLLLDRPLSLEDGFPSHTPAYTLRYPIVQAGYVRSPLRMTSPTKGAPRMPPLDSGGALRRVSISMMGVTGNQVRAPPMKKDVAFLFFSFLLDA